MSGDPTGDVTAILSQARAGDASAASRLLPLVYEELRAKAGSFFRGRNPRHTLQPTALVHEAYLRMVKAEASWESRRHFMAVAATAMRQVLADHARDRGRLKRGGGGQRITLGEPEAASRLSDVDLLALDDALGELARSDERQARIVELRFLGGLAIADIAALLGVSRRTVELDWRVARAWLRDRLGGAESA